MMINLTPEQERRIQEMIAAARTIRLSKWWTQPW